MARVQAEIKFSEQAWKDVDRLLGQVDVTIGGPAVIQALRNVGQMINKRVRAELPKPGYPGDKPGLIPLRDTLGVKTKSYNTGEGHIKVVIIGYKYPQGAHGHLLEGGHDIVVGGSKKRGGQVVGHVQPYEYLIRVVNATRPEQDRMLVDSLRKILAKHQPK